MRVTLAVLVTVLAIGAGFGAGWIAHDDTSSTLTCRDTRPTHTAPLDILKPEGQQGGGHVVNPATPITMHCQTS